MMRQGGHNRLQEGSADQHNWEECSSAGTQCVKETPTHPEWSVPPHLCTLAMPMVFKACFGLRMILSTTNRRHDGLMFCPGLKEVWGRLVYKYFNLRKVSTCQLPILLQYSQAFKASHGTLHSCSCLSRCLEMPVLPSETCFLRIAGCLGRCAGSTAAQYGTGHSWRPHQEAFSGQKQRSSSCGRLLDRRI